MSSPPGNESPTTAPKLPVPTGRQILALLRLLLLYGILCTLVFGAGLIWRQVMESEWNLQPPATEHPRLAGPGLNVALISRSPANQAVELQRLQGLGMTWVRQPIEWSAVEPQPGQYDWDAVDALLAEIDASGLAVLPVLTGSPLWARSERDVIAGQAVPAPPDAPADFARFAGKFAERYADQLRFYQVWHEPNIAPNWGRRHVDPVGYAQLKPLPVERYLKLFPGHAPPARVSGGQDAP